VNNIQSFSVAKGDLRGCESSEQAEETLKEMISKCGDFDDYWHMGAEVSYAAACRVISREGADRLRDFINEEACAKIC